MKKAWKFRRVLFLLLVFPSIALASHPNVIEKVKPSVVKISKVVWESDPLSGIHRYDFSGSGVIVSIDRDRVYILTNRHVADETWHIDQGNWCEIDPMEIDCVPEFVREQTIVTFANGRSVNAVLHWSSSCADLAILETPHPGGTVHTAEIESAVRVGEEVLALGHPLGLEYTLTKGIVSAKRTLAGRACAYDTIQTDASINPGNSGGGLFNSQGRLVGINTFIMRGGQGLGFAIAISHFLREVGQDPSRYAHEHEPPLESRKTAETWVNLMDGSEWDMRFEGDLIYGEYVWPDAQQEYDRAGASILCEMKRQASEWIGKCRARLRVAVSSHWTGKQETKWCRIEMDDVYTLVSPRRIEGKSEIFEWKDFDPKTCEPKKTKWEKFVLVPKE